MEAEHVYIYTISYSKSISQFFLSKTQHDYKWFLQWFNKQEVN